LCVCLWINNKVLKGEKSKTKTNKELSSIKLKLSQQPNKLNSISFSCFSIGKYMINTNILWKYPYFGFNSVLNQNLKIIIFLNICKKYLNIQIYSVIEKCMNRISEYIWFWKIHESNIRIYSAIQNSIFVFEYWLFGD
jgi:hypothetical protein